MLFQNNVLSHGMPPRPNRNRKRTSGASNDEVSNVTFSSVENLSCQQAADSFIATVKSNIPGWDPLRDRCRRSLQFMIPPTDSRVCHCFQIDTTRSREFSHG